MIQQLASKRTLGAAWLGSHYAYEAGLMSAVPELRGEARSRLRMAHEWTRNLSLLPEEERRNETISDFDIAELAIAHFNIHGPAQCAYFLRSWRPRRVSFMSGCILASKFCDSNRITDLHSLCREAGNDLWLILGISVELSQIGQRIPNEVADRSLRLLHRIVVDDPNRYDYKDEILRAVLSIIETGLRSGLHDHKYLADILNQYLPLSQPPVLFSRFSAPRSSLLLAYSLRAALTGEPLNAGDLADARTREQLGDAVRSPSSQEAWDFKHRSGTLLPWSRLWADCVCGRVQSEDLENALAEAKLASDKAGESGASNQYNIANDVARIWFKILLSAEAPESSIGNFNDWVEAQTEPLYLPVLTEIARACGRVYSLRAHSLKYADKARDLAKTERTDADHEAQTYIGLSRATLAVSKTEAESYFSGAIAVVSKIGDESLQRWTAILDLAEAAAHPTRTVPEIAYVFARCGELIYQYLARDKYFDWERCVEALAGLCPTSCLAILSRWRDRSFGRAERLLPTAVQALLRAERISASTGIALIPFRADWDHQKFLGEAFKKPAPDQNKQAMARLCFRYMTLQKHTPEVWRLFLEFVPLGSEMRERIDNSIREAHASNTALDGLREHGQLTSQVQINQSTDPDWQTVFAGDVLSASDLSTAYTRYKQTRSGVHEARFFQEAWKRVGVGGEADFIRTIADSSRIGLYSFQTFLEQVPTDFRSRLSVRSALAYTAEVVCKRHCMEIYRDRYWNVFPFATASEMSGIPESDLLQTVLSAIGESTELVNVRRLFTLVSLLITKLSADEALEALSFGLSLFDGALEDKDGDGPWLPALEPPDDMGICVAGYIWAALASPRASVRWEAAHAVWALCEMKEERIIANLISMAGGNTGGVFADARLYFYHLHGRQWLLTGLARAAKEYPNVLLPHTDFLIRCALESEPHVLMRKFAADAMSSLLNNGLLHVSPELRNRLDEVNKPQGAIRKNPSERVSVKEAKPEEGEHGISFALDIGPYWFRPLGDVFGVSQQAMEQRGRYVIAAMLGYHGTARWVEDQRVTRGIFQEREHWYSHASYPRADDLFFYLSYHAMMIMAGELLASEMEIVRYDDESQPFATWLHRHCLTRRDGYWLFDRRDPTPLDRQNAQDVDEKYWRWSLLKSDFDVALGFREIG